LALAAVIRFVGTDGDADAIGSAWAGIRRNPQQSRCTEANAILSGALAASGIFNGKALKSVETF
jgi:hypothetical protein